MGSQVATLESFRLRAHEIEDEVKKLMQELRRHDSVRAKINAALIDNPFDKTAREALAKQVHYEYTIILSLQERFDAISAWLHWIDQNMHEAKDGQLKTFYSVLKRAIDEIHNHLTKKLARIKAEKEHLPKSKSIESLDKIYALEAEFIGELIRDYNAEIEEEKSILAHDKLLTRTISKKQLIRFATTNAAVGGVAAFSFMQAPLDSNQRFLITLLTIMGITIAGLFSTEWKLELKLSQAEREELEKKYSKLAKTINDWKKLPKPDRTTPHKGDLKLQP